MRELALLSRYIQDWSREYNSVELMQQLDSRIIQITTLSEKEKIHKASDLSIPFINKLEERYNAHGALPGISTGIGTLDDYTLGLQPRLKYEIGGRPSDGKSALMVTLVCNIAVRQNIPCGIISLESSKEELYTRMIANVGSINSQKIQSGLLGTAADFNSVGMTNAKVHDAPIYFYDMPGMTLNDLKMQCRRMVLQHGVKVIFIDYEQLVSIPGVHDMFPRISEVSITIKNIARELNIPIVSLAQLLRRDVTKRPQMADFKGSGQIEQDADGAILIYHKQDSHGNSEGSYLCVEKMRDGRTGDIPIYFDRKHVRFTERSITNE
jgi:replicative DNA helicase